MDEGVLRRTYDSVSDTRSVTLTQPRYDELLEAERKLDALERAGVDNWSGYDYAMEIVGDGEDDGS